MDIEVKPVFRILTEDVLNTFYMFQCFSLWVWFINSFWMYGGAICCMLFVSIYGELSTIYWNLHMLREMARYDWDMKVRRVNERGEQVWKEVNSREIVPGDVIMLPEGKDLPWDAIMLEGESVINEAMLTGESLPTVKMGVPNNEEVWGNFSIENKLHVSLLYLSYLGETLPFLWYYSDAEQRRPRKSKYCFGCENWILLWKREDD
jgi:cation-transporting P-type ATPase 13A2